MVNFRKKQANFSDGCYDKPVVTHDPHSSAPKDLLGTLGNRQFLNKKSVFEQLSKEFCFVKCKEKHDELGHWTHAYVAFMPEKEMFEY